MEPTKEQFYLRRIAELEKENAELRKENIELRQQVINLTKQVASLTEQVAKLSKDSSNSSKPPSSDFPKASPKSKKRRRKKRGARKGHTAHLCELLPPEKVTCHRAVQNGSPASDFEPPDDTSWRFLQDALSAHYFQTSTPSLLPQPI